jgi:hypothetical protein
LLLQASICRTIAVIGLLALTTSTPQARLDAFVALTAVAVVVPFVLLRKAPPVVVKGLSDERKTLAKRYTIDAAETQLSTTSPPEPSLLIPKPVTQAWIETNVPRMSATTLAYFISELRKRNWTDRDIVRRVIPHVRGSK